MISVVCTSSVMNNTSISICPYLQQVRDTIQVVNFVVDCFLSYGRRNQSYSNLRFWGLMLVPFVAFVFPLVRLFC